MRHTLRLLLLCLLCLALPAAPPASAASCSWAGGAAGDWATAANWSCGRVPTAEDSVTIDVYGATVSLTGSAEIASLLVRRGSISGPGALRVLGLARLDVGIDTSISTSGSYLPQLEVDAAGAQVRISDPALADGSLQSLALRGGTLSLAVGSRAIGALSLAPHPLTATAASLAWTGTLTATQSLSWQGGTITRDTANPGAATLIVAPAAALTLAGSTIWGATLINRSAAPQTLATLPTLGGSPRAQLINEGDLTISAPSFLQINGSGDIINRGALRKLGGGRANLGLGLVLINEGLLEIAAGSLRVSDTIEQRAGELRMAGGLQGNNQYSQISFTGGLITGAGVISSSVRLAGATIAPTGTLTILGGYQQSVTSTLRIALRGSAPGSGYGRIVVQPNQGIGGGATLAGRVEISSAGGYLPSSGDRFTVLTCATSCQGSFSSSSGDLTPAFGAFVAAGELVVAEPQFAALAGLEPEQAIMRAGESNAYRITISNPTGQPISVSGLTLTIPVSLTYQAGGTSGAIASDPTSTTIGASRRLSWPSSISVPALGRAEVRVAFSASAGAPRSLYQADLQLTAGSTVIQAQRVAPFEIPLEAAQSVGVGPGGPGMLDTRSSPPTLLVSNLAATRGITISARIACPISDCGQILAVYVLHGGRLHTMRARPAPSLMSGDYGFWDGYISRESVFPGEPTRIFPDWQHHRSCIYYDYGGGGGRPQGCSDSGDFGPIPELFDPSGVVTDAVTGAPIAGATVTLVRVPGALPDTAAQTRDCRTVDTRGGSIWSGVAPDVGVDEEPALMPRQIDPQVNPQVTGADGRYGWNVVSGCWYVRVSAPGYQPRISPLVGVPPEVTDLDLTLQPGERQRIFLPLVGRG